MAYTLGAPCRISGLVQSGIKCAVPPGESTLSLRAAAAATAAEGTLPDAIPNDGVPAAGVDGAGDAVTEGMGDGSIASSHSSSHCSRTISSLVVFNELNAELQLAGCTVRHQM